MTRQKPVVLPTGDTLAAARRDLRMTQEELASEVNDYLRRRYSTESDEFVEALLVNPHQYGDWERGGSEPPSRYLEALSVVLQVPVAQLLGMEDAGPLSADELRIIRKYRAIHHPIPRQMVEVILDSQLVADRELTDA